MSIRITKIQHFCLQDGPGIRTTVFLKGCNLKCPWCANPECISFDIEEYGEEKFGVDISWEDLERELLKDYQYYTMNNGGVTFSGGEPLLQIKKLKPLLISLKQKNINICFETALMVNQNLLKEALPFIDELIIDIKILDKKSCEKVIGGNIDTYLNNVEFIFSFPIPIIFRIPLALDYTLTNDNINLLIDFLDKYKPDKLEIFKIHNLAKEKYAILNKEYYHTEIKDEIVNDFLKLINNKVDKIEILNY